MKYKEHIARIRDDLELLELDTYRLEENQMNSIRKDIYEDIYLIRQKLQILKKKVEREETRQRKIKH